MVSWMDGWMDGMGWAMVVYCGTGTLAKEDLRCELWVDNGRAKALKKLRFTDENS